MGYSIEKLIHLLAVVLFLGNIITGLFWMSFAVRTQDLKIINHTMKGIIRADRIFTIPSVIVLVLLGVGAALHGKMSILGTGWILWSIVMISISGFAFSAKLAPLQRKIYQLTLDFENPKSFNWEQLFRLLKLWHFWGMVATLTPIVAFVMMVLKVPK